MVSNQQKSNMYKDAIIWNIGVGCNYNCKYCDPSFKRQMKRQKPTIDKNGKKRGCQQCYDYVPHFHEERLNNKLPLTKGDEFIWVGSSGDISFIDDHSIFEILEKIREYPDRTFFFQTKNPKWFQKWEFPKNVVLGITLESNIHYPLISKAPKPWSRAAEFYFVCHPRKRVTIEPILDFDHNKFFAWIRDINPEIVYVGYNSKDSKNCHLPEPSLAKTELFISDLRKITRVKEKLMRKAWDEK